MPPRPVGNVSVLLGNGNGTFQAQQTFGLGGNPSSLALGDLNGDGIPDVVVADYVPGGLVRGMFTPGYSAVSVLLGSGGGTFQGLQNLGNFGNFGAGVHPSSVALGDVNGDNEIDIAVANRDNDTVGVLLGDGGGTFQVQQTFAAGAYPASVALGDVNGDGKPDLLTANNGSNTVSVLLGNGDGSFQAQQTLATGAYPAAVTLGELTGDGKTDIVVANYGSNTVSVLLNNGNGDFSGQTYNIFAPATQFAVTGLPANFIAGNTVPITVTALDQFGNTAIGYTGTVHFTSTDGGAVLPADYTFVPADQGVHVFSSSVTLVTPGSQTLTATDTLTSSVTATTNPVLVNLFGAHFSVSVPSRAMAGSPFDVTVTALDGSNLLVPGYVDPVGLSSTDSAANLPASSPLSAGTGIFTVTLQTPGSQTLTATDALDSSITATSTAVTIFPAGTHFTITGTPTSILAGATVSFTVTIEDAGNNTLTGYNGTIQFTSNDPQAVLPADATLTDGVGFFDATLKTAGIDTLTATDIVASSIQGTSPAVTVNAAAANHFAVEAPPVVTPGSTFNVTVIIQDTFNNTVPNYTGTVSFSSTDPTATLPGSSTLTGGVGVFSNVVLNTLGSERIFATDFVSASTAIVGVAPSYVATVVPNLTITLQASSTTAGPPPVSGTIEEEELGTPLQGDTDTIYLSSSDPLANFQPYYVVLNNGVGSFSITSYTAGAQTVTATDPILKEQGTAGITVTPSAVSQFALSASSPLIAAGSAVTFTVTAEDAYGNAVPGYTGTVHFTSSDPQAVLPPDATLMGGVGVFSANLKTAGTMTLTATDTVTSTIAGTTAVSVNPGQPTQFGIRDPMVTAGTGVVVTVIALDSYGNPALFYAGTVHFSSSDHQAGLPGDATMSTSAGTFSIILKSAGIQTVTAADLGNVTMTGSTAFTVTPAQAASFVVTEPSSVTAGLPFLVTVTAFDSFGNKATGYLGSVMLTSSDPAASLPASTTLTNGSAILQATLISAGVQTFTAADTANSAFSGQRHGQRDRVAGHALPCKRSCHGQCGRHFRDPGDRPGRQQQHRDQL